MDLELERRDDTEIPAAAPHRPEQVAVLALARSLHLAIGSDDLDRHDVIQAEAKGSAQPAEAARQRQAANAGRRHNSARRREAMRLGRAIEIRPGRAAANPRPLCRRIDTHGSHHRQIDQQATVARTAARSVVPTTPDREQHSVLARIVDRRTHIIGRGAAGDQRRLLVEHRVPDLPDLVIVRVPRLDEFATELRPKAGRRSQNSPANDCADADCNSMICLLEQSFREPRHKAPEWLPSRSVDAKDGMPTDEPCSIA